MTASRLRPISRLKKDRPVSAGAVQSVHPYQGLVAVPPLKTRWHTRASPQLALLCGANFGDGVVEHDPPERPPSAEAWQLIEAGQYAAAVARLDAEIALQPAVPSLYSSRALAHLELGQVEKAVADCEASISVAPDEVDGYLRLASMCDTVGQRARAISGIQLGLQRFPNHSEMIRVLQELDCAYRGQNEASTCGDPGDDHDLATKTATLMVAAGDEDSSIALACVDLIVRGRTLFRSLPQKEREDIYRALKAGDSLVARMVRDACAVTLQCAVRLHQVRLFNAKQQYILTVLIDG